VQYLNTYEFSLLKKLICPIVVKHDFIHYPASLIIIQLLTISIWNRASVKMLPIGTTPFLPFEAIKVYQTLIRKSNNTYL